MKVNKVYIVTDVPFPIGFAPTNRILTYCTGFRKNGIECEVIIFRKTENYYKIVNAENTGRIDGTQYSYLFKSTIKSKFFIRRRIDNVLGLIYLLGFALFKMNNNSIIIYYSSYTRYALLLRISKFLKRHLILKEESEHPEIRRKVKNHFSWLLFSNVHYSLFDGFLLMTKNLFQYFKNKYPNKPSIIIPMTVDLDRFNKLNVKKEKKITYIGSLINKKDGVLYLLEAFSLILKVYNDYKLTICGYASSIEDKILFQNALNKLSIKQSVIFLENVKSYDIPMILKSSSILVLPRPDSIQAQNGFPTKLGEYLASSTPTLVTSVGEIPRYLQDGKNSFFAEPGNINSLVQKLKEILIDIEKAEEVGRKGRIIAEKHFNNVIQTQKIINFLQHSF